MKTLIDLFTTLEVLGDKIAFVNRTGKRRLVVSYGEYHDLSMKMARQKKFHSNVSCRGRNWLSVSR